MLELKNITVTTEDGNTILNNISLTVEDAKFVAITGPNGGGKSTLAKVIMGIMNPSSGQIFFNGIDVTKKSITERANLGIAFSFQQPVRFKGITVKDIIRLASGDENLNNADLCSYLRQVGLCAKDYIDRPIDSSLSGGEIKRVEIASVLARKANLSVFDEPEAGIDLWSFQNLINVFQNMRKDTSGSILVISHQERILSIADEIIVIKKGQIDSRGSAEEIMPKLLCENETCEIFNEEV